MSTDEWCSGYHGWVSIMCNALVAHLSWLLAEVHHRVNELLPEVHLPESTPILTLAGVIFMIILSLAICLVLTNLVLMCIRSLLRISILIVVVATLLIAGAAIAAYVHSYMKML